MVSATTTEYPSAAIVATKILYHISKLRNVEVTDSLVNEITISIRNLINYCNSKILKDFPIDVVYKPTKALQREINSWYCPDLNVTNIHEYIISTFNELERDSYHTQIEPSNRCIDAVYVLVDYFNAVVQYRSDHYLELQEKKLDGQSSKSVETSIQLVNGDGFYG